MWCKSVYDLPNGKRETMAWASVQQNLLSQQILSCTCRVIPAHWFPFIPVLWSGECSMHCLIFILRAVKYPTRVNNLRDNEDIVYMRTGEHRESSLHPIRACEVRLKSASVDEQCSSVFRIQCKSTQCLLPQRCTVPTNTSTSGRFCSSLTKSYFSPQWIPL